MRNGRAEKLIELNGTCETFCCVCIYTNQIFCQYYPCFDYIPIGNPRLHLKALDQVVSCSGDPSLQNALEMAMRALRYSSPAKTIVF